MIKIYEFDRGIQLNQLGFHLIRAYQTDFYFNDQQNFLFSSSILTTKFEKRKEISLFCLSLKLNIYLVQHLLLKMKMKMKMKIK